MPDSIDSFGVKGMNGWTSSWDGQKDHAIYIGPRNDPSCVLWIYTKKDADKENGTAVMLADADAIELYEHIGKILRERGLLPEGTVESWEKELK